MANDKDVYSDCLKKICKYCSKNVSTGLFCEKCETVFHFSCAQRVKTCCGTNISANYEKQIQSKCEVMKPRETDANNFTLEENKLLKQIIRDKDIIICDKQHLISLLNEKICELEDKIKYTLQNVSSNTGNNSEKNQVTTKHNFGKTKKSTKKGEIPKKTQEVTHVISTIEVNTPDLDDPNFSPMEPSSNNFKTRTVGQKLVEEPNLLVNDEFDQGPSIILHNSNKISNILTTKNHQNLPKNKEIIEENEEFQTVQYKKRSRNKNRPTPLKGVNSDNLLKVVKNANADKSGIFISGFAPETKADDIINYLKKYKLDNGSTCDKMITKKSHYYSSFKLCVPKENFEVVMSAELWPLGTTINHFLHVQRPRSSPRRQDPEPQRLSSQPIV